MRINGERGQRIQLRYADSLKGGDLDIAGVWFVRDNWDRDKDIVHKDTYICKGVGDEVYTPTFTYHGFRYVKVLGISEEQATSQLLTYIVYHTELNTRGDFCCSDSVASILQQVTRRSIVSNFHHFPTDCPQREKNGWTADAALTCEAALLNFDPERNYREWMRNIRKAQLEDGSLPGIIPTGGWGYYGNNGPAWDCVLAWIPYYTYVYRGQTDMILESAESFISYLKYLRGRCDADGLLSIGLGDWCHVVVHHPKAPLLVTDTVTAMDIASKMAIMLDAVGMRDDAAYARDEEQKYREAIRKKLIDHSTLRVMGDCQSSQALALYYGVFEKSEEEAAFARLLEMIHDCDDHIDIGVLGARVIFHVLSRFGYSSLAYKMITREDFPSYGNWIKRGATTLWESFKPDMSDSMNHHFWGDISAWFIKCIAGINLNPNIHNCKELRIKPSFIKELDMASAYHVAPAGRIAVKWVREGGELMLDLTIPRGICATAELEQGYSFEDGSCKKHVAGGRYKILEK
jgi:alpha-L-rhamnosidase